jgi:anti-anti-sigma factor
MTIEILTSGNIARMKISDCFDSSVYPDFKKAYSPLMTDASVQKIEVDVSGLEYMDSAALGMLMQLNENAKHAGKSVSLVGVPGRVADILRVAHADKLFSINLPSGMKLDLRS